MSIPVSPPLRRYRRRILGWGLLGAVVLCGVGAPLFVRGVERDLERRVPSELAERGFAGVTATFSGQDGVLRCAAPLAEPEQAIDAAIDVWGVRAIDLDRSCRVGGAGGSGDDVDGVEPTSPAATAGTADGDGGTSGGPADTSGEEPGSTAASDEPDRPDQPDFASIVDVVDSGPQFSILASLIDEAGLGAMFSGPGPFTLFAASDAAFESLSADTLATLRADPDQLTAVLEHHTAAGSLASDELEPGELEMLDGATLAVTVAGDEITIGEASVTEADLSAGNGIVHVIDRVLLPVPTPAEPADRVPTVSATLALGRLVLSGAVADDAQRAVLVDAASAVLDAANVDDQLTVAAGTEIDTATVAALAELVAAMPPHLVRGESGVDGTDLYADGVYVDPPARTAFEAVAAVVAADVVLEARPTASAADAAALEAELNELVGTDPILFAPGGSELAPEASAVLDRLAGIAEQYAGLAITIEGHTDSDGDPAANQSLSEQRAATVRDELVARGVPAADLVATGLGSRQPIVVDGVEDKDASRRVAFRVTIGDGA